MAYAFQQCKVRPCCAKYLKRKSLASLNKPNTLSSWALGRTHNSSIPTVVNVEMLISEKP